MTKYLKYISILFLFNSASAKEEVITVRSDVWCPYFCEEPGKPGILVEVLNKGFEKKGYKVDFQFLNWARSVEETRAGKHNAIAGASVSDAPDFIFPKNAPLEMVSCIYVNPNGKFKYEGMKSLNKVKLGAAKDYTYGKEVDEYLLANNKNKNRVEFASGDSPTEVNMKKLEGQRIEAFVEDKNVLNYKLSKAAKNAFIPLEAECVSRTELSYGFAPKNVNSKKYAEALSDGIAELKKDGQLEDLKKKYNIK